MKLIISPAKKMNCQEDSIHWKELPCFLDQTRILLNYIRGLSLSEAQALWRCNDELADLNYHRFQEMNLDSRLTPAILAYEGIQYQYMSPQVFEQASLDYVQEHLRILSGFYGILKPLDGVVPYRLEMQARILLELEGHTYRSLYDFWGDRIFETLTARDQVIINLASKEYSRAIEPFVTEKTRMIHVTFGTLSPDSKVRVKATQAKMARGEMVRYLAGIQAENPEDLKGFRSLGYAFCPDHSNENHYVFIK